ncbi:hypothetical protein ACFOL3_06760, partial [Streptomyces nitrosporeus]
MSRVRSGSALRGEPLRRCRRCRSYRTAWWQRAVTAPAGAGDVLGFDASQADLPAGPHVAHGAHSPAGSAGAGRVPAPAAPAAPGALPTRVQGKAMAG